MLIMVREVIFEIVTTGAEVMAGYFPNEGFKLKVNASIGAGGGLLFRIRPKF